MRKLLIFFLLMWTPSSAWNLNFPVHPHFILPLDLVSVVNLNVDRDHVKKVIRLYTNDGLIYVDYIYNKNEYDFVGVQIRGRFLIFQFYQNQEVIRTQRCEIHLNPISLHVVGN